MKWPDLQPLGTVNVGTAVNVDKMVSADNPVSFDDTVNVDKAVNVDNAVNVDTVVNVDEDSLFSGRSCVGMGGPRWGKGCGRGRR